MGDLAFLHDVNALAARADDLPLTFLLLDNGGGGIFDHLPQNALPEFERGWRTPTNYRRRRFRRAPLDWIIGASRDVAEGVDAPLGRAWTGRAQRSSTPSSIRAFSLSLCRTFFATSQENA